MQLKIHIVRNVLHTHTQHTNDTFNPFGSIMTVGIFDTTHTQVYVNLNNLQHVKNALASIPQTLQVAAIISAVDGPSMLDVQRFVRARNHVLVLK